MQFHKSSPEAVVVKIITLNNPLEPTISVCISTLLYMKLSNSIDF